MQTLKPEELPGGQTFKFEFETFIFQFGTLHSKTWPLDTLSLKVWWVR
jgi:hypothetical protein